MFHGEGVDAIQRFRARWTNNFGTASGSDLKHEIVPDFFGAAGMVITRITQEIWGGIYAARGAFWKGRSLDEHAIAFTGLHLNSFWIDRMHRLWPKVNWAAENVEIYGRDAIHFLLWIRAWTGPARPELTESFHEWC